MHREAREHALGHVIGDVAVEEPRPGIVGVHAGAPATFSVAASGVPILYQWLRNGSVLSVDTNGNVYVGGSLNLKFDGSNNAGQLRVMKFSSAGALLWQRDLLAEFYFFDFSSVTDARRSHLGFCGTARRGCDQRRARQRGGFV